MGGFTFRRTDCRAAAVVFQGGTAIIIRTERTQKIIDKMIRDIPNKRWAWVKLANNLIEEFIKKVPNDNSEERKTFSINFAREYGMKLLFIPAESKKIEVLV